ncbi:hypothetical protein PVAP13_6NG362932 [Panicum virgatum]|uniref:Uncharacterized protein n=1 Tax=Panicum virgatum TaxID=38727 RepID=A0A8T0R710_PANVG|nr:hypothetical protein PVAP13_6NG362932 [Panicum virgatum]
MPACVDCVDRGLFSANGHDWSDSMMKLINPPTSPTRSYPTPRRRRPPPHRRPLVVRSPPPARRPVAAALSASARRLPRLPSSPGTTSGALLSPAEMAPLAVTAAAALACTTSAALGRDRRRRLGLQLEFHGGPQLPELPLVLRHLPRPETTVSHRHRTF